MQQSEPSVQQPTVVAHSSSRTQHHTAHLPVAAASSGTRRGGSLHRRHEQTADFRMMSFAASQSTDCTLPTSHRAPTRGGAMFGGESMRASATALSYRFWVTIQQVPQFNLVNKATTMGLSADATHVELQTDWTGLFFASDEAEGEYTRELMANRRSLVAQALGLLACFILLLGNSFYVTDTVQLLAICASLAVVFLLVVEAGTVLAKMAHPVVSTFREVLNLSVACFVIVVVLGLYAYDEACLELPFFTLSSESTSLAEICSARSPLYAIIGMTIMFLGGRPRAAYTTIAVVVGVISTAQAHRIMSAGYMTVGHVSSNVILVLTLFTGVTVLQIAQERHHRSRFIRGIRLALAVEELAKRKEVLASYIDTIISPALRERLLVEPSLLDYSQDASAVLIEIFDFDEFQTRTLPEKSVVTVAKIQDAIMRCAHTCGVFRVGTNGDQFIGCANVLDHVPQHQQNVLRCAFLAIDAADQQRDEFLHCSLRSSTASGTLVGAVVGYRAIRYDVFGQALNDAHSILRFSGERGVVCNKQLAQRGEADSSCSYFRFEQSHEDMGPGSFPFWRVVLNLASARDIPDPSSDYSSSQKTYNQTQSQSDLARSSMSGMYPMPGMDPIESIKQQSGDGSSVERQPLTQKWIAPASSMQHGVSQSTASPMSPSKHAVVDTDVAPKQSNAKNPLVSASGQEDREREHRQVAEEVVPTPLRPGTLTQRETNPIGVAIEENVTARPTVSFSLLQQTVNSVLGDNSDLQLSATVNELKLNAGCLFVPRFGSKATEIAYEKWSVNGMLVRFIIATVFLWVLIVEVVAITASQGVVSTGDVAKSQVGVALNCIACLLLIASFVLALINLPRLLYGVVLSASLAIMSFVVGVPLLNESRIADDSHYALLVGALVVSFLPLNTLLIGVLLVVLIGLFIGATAAASGAMFTFQFVSSLLIVAAIYAHALARDIANREFFSFVKTEEEAARMRDKDENLRRCVLRGLFPPPLHAMLFRLHANSEQNLVHANIVSTMIVMMLRVDNFSAARMVLMCEKDHKAALQRLGDVHNFIEDKILVFGGGRINFIKFCADTYIVAGPLEKNSEMTCGATAKAALEVLDAMLGDAKKFDIALTCVMVAEMGATITTTGDMPMFDLLGVAPHRARALINTAAPGAILVTDSFVKNLEEGEIPESIKIGTRESWRIRSHGIVGVHTVHRASMPGSSSTAGSPPRPAPDDELEAALAAEEMEDVSAFAQGRSTNTPLSLAPVSTSSALSAVVRLSSEGVLTSPSRPVHDAESPELQTPHDDHPTTTIVPPPVS